jgi:hypothetical protein
MGAAFGAMPPRGHEVEVASGANLPVVYHGGVVMRDVTIHTVFWAPPGYHFDPAPTLVLTKSYELMIQQFFTDAAHDSGKTTNVFSVLPQYGDAAGPGTYQLHYDPTVDSLDVADPYPPKSKQCASPAGVQTCVTDLQVQQELDTVITAHDPSGRGLHDVWFVFLPPDVDECTNAGVCGTNAFAGYHSLSNVGHGPTVYSPIPSPLIEFTPGPGTDPEGNPEAEVTIDTAAHEAVEAITDPYGTGWMDPNGFEVADDCENPETGPPLGYALLNGSPYNQIINNHPYLIQMMWSNTDVGCVQHNTSTTSALPLATVNLTQFSRTITGNIGTAHGGIPVEVGIVRTEFPVALGVTRTRPDGRWKMTLGHAVGDDRDLIIVHYGKGGPKPDVIETGSGGNPFTESGWTGWFDLDHGYVVGHKGVILGPCGQTGVLSLTIGGTAQPAPVEQCQTESDVTVAHTPVGLGTRISMSSTDDRAVSHLNPNGALVKLSVKLGEPDAVAAVGNSQLIVEPSGFPLCTAHLEFQAVSCNGLVPGGRYTLAGHRARADLGGTISVPMRVRGGDVITLKNGARRTLTTLHVAHLRVAVDGHQDVLASGSCQAGDYYGPGLRHPPLGPAIGHGGATGNGLACPPDGHAAGLPAFGIQQTDDRSGGLTQTVIPDLASITPNNGGTVYGGFTAAAQPAKLGADFSVVGVPATVSLSITRLGAHHRAFFARNVAVASGVRVGALPHGVYDATWVVRDVNGDSRTVHSRFVEAG